jgi:hypothetical protein
LAGFEVEGQDTHRYGRLARQGIDARQVAYRDFDVEYPPVAWWLMTLPRLIDAQTYADPNASPETVRQFFRWYYACFHGALFLIDVVCCGLMFVIGRKMLPSAAWAPPAAYTLLAAAQPHLIYDRLDLGLLMFFLLFVVCWLRALEMPSGPDRWGSDLWSVAGYLFLGLGISFKIMPVIFVPFLLLADAWAVASAWRLAGRILALAVGVLVPFLAHLPSAGWSVLRLFRYHGERGIHLESIWGSILVAAGPLGVTFRVIRSHGGYNLESDWSGALKFASSASLVAIAASFGLWALLRGRRFDRRLALDTAILVLVDSTVFAHVFSPQYLNWLLPLALLLALNTFPRNWIPWCGFAALAATIVGISTWLFPNHYTGYLTTLETFPVALSVIRSACLLGLALLLSVRFFATYGLMPWRASDPAHGARATAA